MTIHIQLESSLTATVIERPNLIARVFGAPIDEYHAFGDERGRWYRWSIDGSERRCSARVEAMLERRRKKLIEVAAELSRRAP